MASNPDAADDEIRTTREAQLEAALAALLEDWGWLVGCYDTQMVCSEDGRADVRRLEDLGHAAQALLGKDAADV